MDYFGLVFVTMGIFCVCGAAFDWGIFMNSHKAWFVKKIFGHDGARIFYVLFGILFIIVGFGFTFGFIKDSTR